MSYRLIDSNNLALKYPEANDMPCIFADLPNGLDGKHYTLETSRKGHWETYYIEHTDGYVEEWHKCSECEQDSEYNWDFCHWCGADMRGDSE